MGKSAISEDEETKLNGFWNRAIKTLNNEAFTGQCSVLTEYGKDIQRRRSNLEPLI